MYIYKVMTIKTAYSTEKFLFNYDSKSNDSIEKQAENFLSDYCFCDDFEIISIRNATKEENILMKKYLEKMDFWEAQSLLCKEK